eukprot:scaffold11223_cov60-Phaeocystis_antarctica.AAC.1
MATCAGGGASSRASCGSMPSSLSASRSTASCPRRRSGCAPPTHASGTSSHRPRACRPSPRRRQRREVRPRSAREACRVRRSEQRGAFGNDCKSPPERLQITASGCTGCRL